MKVSEIVESLKCFIDEVNTPLPDKRRVEDFVKRHQTLLGKLQVVEKLLIEAPRAVPDDLLDLYRTAKKAVEDSAIFAAAGVIAFVRFSRSKRKIGIKSRTIAVIRRHMHDGLSSEQLTESEILTLTDARRLVRSGQKTL